jgi:hypothetical protein
MKPFMFCNDYMAFETEEIITVTNTEKPRTIIFTDAVGKVTRKTDNRDIVIEIPKELKYISLMCR